MSTKPRTQIPRAGSARAAADRITVPDHDADGGTRTVKAREHTPPLPAPEPQPLEHEGVPVAGCKVEIVSPIRYPATDVHALQTEEVVDLALRCTVVGVDHVHEPYVGGLTRVHAVEVWSCGYVDQATGRAYTNDLRAERLAGQADTDTADPFAVAKVFTGWLDNHNGRDSHEITLRILKVAEEAGEAAAARIGSLGQNPRKGYSHNDADTVAELADVVFTALVAIASLGCDPAAELAVQAVKVADRLAAEAETDRLADQRIADADAEADAERRPA